MYESKQNTSCIPFFDYSPVRPQRTVLFFYEEPTASHHLCFWRCNPINVHIWNAPISNCLRLLYVRVFSPSAAILENKKTLGMRLAWARKVDSPISCLKTVIAFLLCIAYMKIQCLSQHSRCATDTLPILDQQVLMHCRQYRNYCDHLLTDEWLMISYSSTDTQLTIAGTGPALAWHSNDKSIDILTNTRLMRWSTPPIRNKIYPAYIVVSLSIVEDNNKGKFHVK